MGTVLPAIAPQTLYVTVRRDELRKLKEEREQLQNKVAPSDTDAATGTAEQHCSPERLIPLLFAPSPRQAQSAACPT